jgi:hypothetical protein
MTRISDELIKREYEDKLAEEKKKEIERKLKRERQEIKMKSLEQVKSSLTNLTKQEITDFTHIMIGGCLQLLDDDPETVYR